MTSAISKVLCLRQHHSTILLGGQETTTSALSRILYVLAREPHAQARLRSEIRDAKIAYAAAHGIESDWESVSLSYDALMSLPYLDAVVRETLRLHPPTTVINRMYVHSLGIHSRIYSHTLYTIRVISQGYKRCRSAR